MSVPPRFAATVFSPGSSPSNLKHVVEIYFDFMCPWCRKLFRTLDNEVVPWLRGTPYADKMDIVIRPQIQPWDLPSTYATEAALIVNVLAPGDSEAFWKYTRGFTERREEFMSRGIANELRNDTYKRLAKLVEESTGIDADKVFALLEVSEDKPENRKPLMFDTKRITKAARKVGNHVTPTVYIDGLEEVGMDSSWTFAQWKEWIEKNIV